LSESQRLIDWNLIDPSFLGEKDSIPIGVVLVKSQDYSNGAIMTGPPQQRRGSPNTMLETRSSEAPWMRDHRRTPRSARSRTNNNPFESPTGATAAGGSQRGVIDSNSNQRNLFAQTPVRDNRKNPFDSPGVIQQQRQRNMNPFDSPSNTPGSNSRTTITTTVTPVGRMNPFDSPLHEQRTSSTTRNNPFDTPSTRSSQRPPVTPKRQRNNSTPINVMSPAKQESVALDSLEQILDTTDDTTTDEEMEVLTDGAAMKSPERQSPARQAYPYPQYHDTTTTASNGNHFTPSPFRTPTPSQSSFATPSTHSSHKKTYQTPPTAASSNRSLGSWADAVSQETTPSDRALRAAETLRRNFEHRRRKTNSGSTDPSDILQQELDHNPYEQDIELELAEEDSTLDGLVFEYSKSGGSEKRETVNPPANATESPQSFGHNAFREEKKVDEAVLETPTGSAEHVEEISPTESDAMSFVLHDLCDEARTTDDLAWRNALSLLAAQPQIAGQQEPECNMTALHVACLAHEPPPLWMTRGLLYTCPTACRQVDSGGRLPLHLLVATSADVETVRLLVEEYPPSVAHKDDRGFTPLQLLLKNDQIDLTLEHIRLLLGQLSYGTTGTKQKRSKLLFRKGDHLESSIEELEELEKEREEAHESTFREYPDDVRRALTKLSQWKRRQDNKQAQRTKRERQEHFMFLQAGAKDFENPASIPTPTGQLLPLHLLVRRQTRTEPRQFYAATVATHEDLVRVMIAAYPQALVGTDAHGKTPVMTAMLQSDVLPNAEVVELLLGLRTPGFNSWNRKRPALIPSRDTGQLPLHVAAEELLSDYSLLSTICEAYPDARSVQDFRGRTPLHLALQNYRSFPVDEPTLALLYVDAVARIKDNDGKTPFDLLVENPKCVRQSPPLTNGVKFNSLVFQDFLDASMERPRNRREADVFLRQFRDLPPWLRRQACAAGSVQDTLTEEIASPFNTFRILGSGFVLVILLALLRRLLHANSDLSDLIYYLAAYHLTIQVVFCGIALYMGEFFRLCFTNLWRWMDLAAGILAIWCAHEVGARSNDGSTSEGRLSNLGAAATAACWLSLLGYMVDWWCGVAVFVGSATQLLSVLIWPLCLAAMGIVATSQVLYTLDDCVEEGVCTLSEACTLVYFMILGEPVLSEEYELSQGMWFTVVVFTILWIWWIFSTMAMVLTEAKQLDRKQIAVAWYWEAKVVLTVMASDVTKAKISDVPSFGERYISSMENAWNIFASALGGEQSETLWNSCCLRTKAATFFTAFLALVVVPLWLALGLLTLGLLWPPQVRRWIFHSWDPNPSSTSQRRQNTVLSTEDELTRAKLSQLRADIFELKAVAYDQSYQVQKDLGFLKDIIFRAVMDEDDEVRRSKRE
jgi:ankyrin repeat protein